MANAGYQSEGYPCLNIFQRYQLSGYFSETGKGGYPFDEHRGQLSEAAYGIGVTHPKGKACLQPNN